MERKSKNARQSNRLGPAKSDNSAVDPSKPKMLRGTRRGRRSHHKVRVHLPPIESYERELEYPADAPGRVVVRLERLMGTDRVRLTDTKYMGTLLERLEEEERKAWTKRRVARIKTERLRFRKLAIDGLMEPGPDMQDLYQHPVFRVNRVLNRLQKMDTNITLTPMDKLPPIIEVDPFLDDDTGGAFKSYPGHGRGFRKSGEPDEGLVSIYNRHSTTDQFARLSSSHTQKKSKSKLKPPGYAFAPEEGEAGEESEAGSTTMPKPSIVRIRISEADGKLRIPGGDGEEEDEEYEEKPHKKYRATSHQVNLPLSDEKIFDEQTHHTPIRGKSRTFSTSSIVPPPKRMSEMSFPELTEEMERYGIPPDTYMDDGEPFRSFLIDAIFREDGERGILKLYQLAEDVLGVYEREVLVGDDFSSTLNKIFRGEQK